MTAAAGRKVKAEDINKLGRVNQTDATSDSSSTSGTTELSIDQVTVDVVAGRRYKVAWQMSFAGTTTSDSFLVRLREGSGTSGLQMIYACPIVPAVSGNQATIRVLLQAEWTASSTGSKTFTGTLQRNSGTGTAQAAGATTNPRCLSVDYVSGD